MPGDLRTALESRCWKIGLTPQRPAQQRQALTLTEYPGWHLRLHQTRRWHLWSLYDEAQAESADSAGHFALITVDRRDEAAVVTFRWALLEAWLRGERPFVVPRRKRRAGFSHHRQLDEVAAEGVPLLVSRQAGQPILVSVPLAVFKRWLDAFPPPRRHAREDGDPLTLSLWSAASEEAA